MAPTPIPADAVAAYVRTALQVQGYALDDDATAAVVEQFARVAAMADGLRDHPFALDQDAAPAFRP